jgi:hypothetical protein
MQSCPTVASERFMVGRRASEINYNKLAGFDGRLYSEMFPFFDANLTFTDVVTGTLQSK